MSKINIVLNSDVVFKSEDYEFADSDVVAVCMGATEKYRYDTNGNKTDSQMGWSYKVYVPARDMMISIGVENLTCAINAKKQGITEVKFINFRATFYVDRKGYIQLSCKADRAEKVVSDNERKAS